MESTQTLSSYKRQQNLLNFINRRHRATVNEMAEHFSVSVATVRRDLETLAGQNVIRRFHGGAMTAQKAPPESPVLQREQEQNEEKKRIGRAAADLIQDGETVFLGSGTTVLEIARNLRSCQNLTVITNSLLVINALTDAPGVEIVALGGMLRRSEMSMIGHITQQALAEVLADKVIIGVRALDIERGLTNDYLPETMTDRAILKIGGEVIVAADHSKCGRVSTAFLAPVTAINTFITDTETPSGFVEDLKTQGVKVIIV